ncbi:hypothetical protein C8R47DRAFT_1087799 [Mycena vitilis]|nr:hypothetical protein C8R47DRAFT_1087799 [Mycena vitilis]
MSASLPDEIISEILLPALKVSDQMFSDTSSTSPFASASVSSSAALLVCKAWLRVSTPLLYHVVVIRSKAQARALQNCLRGNPDLGRFVKMLRVEGGFGPAMQEILQNSPNITDIFLSLQIHASDSTDGLVGGLQYINPSRIIIFDHANRQVQLKNKQVQGLIGALEARAPKWSNLNTLSLPYSTVTESARQSLISTLCACSTLRTLSFPFLSRSQFKYLVDISRLPSLETIQIRTPASKAHEKVVASISKDPRLLSLVRWLDEPEVMPRNNETVFLQPSDPSFRPMASAPLEIVESVWSRSLEFAMLSFDAGFRRASDVDSTSSNHIGVYHDRLQFLFVSKMFNRLAIPHLYRHIAFPGWGPLHALASRLAATPSLGVHVRSIAIRWDPFGPKVDLSSIFCHTPQLETLVGHKGFFSNSPTISWTTLEALGQIGGASLRELTGFQYVVADDSVPSSPAVFGRFTALRSLDWTVGYRSVTDVPFFDPDAAAPTDGLPALECLRAGSSAGLELFARMDLPSLRRVDLDLSEYRDPAFLQKHGLKLEELKIKETDVRGTASILTLCPGISVLSCTVHPQSGNDFGSNHLAPGFQHGCLATLIVDKDALSNKLKDQQDWKEFTDRLNLAYFPSLSEIRVMAISEWPTTEHAISKSMWVKLAEKLLPRGIHVTTASGVRWHPRLKASRARR